MKSISSLLLLLLICSFQSFSQDLLTITGRLSNYRSHQTENDFGERQLSLLRGKDTIVKSIKTNMGEFAVSGLQPGQYTLRFFNISNQEVKQSLLVAGNLKDVVCCTDAFIDTPGRTFIEKIPAAGKITLAFGSLGCFHNVQSSIEIEKKNVKLIASFYSSGNNKVMKVLSKRDIAAFVLFEKQLYQMKNVTGGCTTVDYYNYIVDGKTVLSVSDDSCDWNGYSLLIREIFGAKI